MSYDQWQLYLPEGRMLCKANAETYASEIRRVGGEDSFRAWKRLEQELMPLGQAAAALPATALRFDPWVALTTSRFLPGLLQAGMNAGAITGTFGAIVDKHAPRYFYSHTHTWNRSRS